MSADSVIDDRQYPGLHETLFRAAGAGVLIIDRHGEICEANSEAGRIFELEPAALVRKKLYELLPAVRVAEWRNAVQSAFHDGQERLLVEECGVRRCRIGFYPIVEPEGRITHAVIGIHDITDQWVCEIRYRELYQHMGRGVLICESPDAGMTFTVKEMNSSALASCVACQTDAVGKPVSEVMPDVEKSGLLAMMHRVYTSSNEERKLFFLQDDSGRGLWLDTSVFTLPNRELVVTFDDITVKYETEQILRRSKEEWEKTFDALSDIVTIQDRDMRIIRANKAAYTMFNLQFKDVIGRKCFDIFQGFDEPCKMCPVVATAGDCRIHNGLIHNVKLDKTFDVRSSPIFDEAGELKWLVQIGRDVTREDSLERQLQQAMRMEAIGTLAGGIAHDFNNILSAMIGYSHIAKGKLEKSSPVQEDIDQILAGGDRAADLVKQILTFARQEPSDSLIPLKIQFIIREVLKLLRSSLPATIVLKQHIDDSSGPILADSSQMHQLLMNLCTNAKQAIGSEHGMITIRLGQCPAGELPAYDDAADVRADKYLHLSVEDTGSGMTPQVLERIFDPFFTTHGKEHGTGLGLAVVHGIVKKHNGYIFVESEPGRGTAFHLYFPVLGQEPHPPKEIPSTEYRGNERIMVIDDDPSVGLVHEKMLSKLGYRVTLYTDSLEAVKKFRENPNCCDLVLTDMTMPNMTGAELAREMLSLRPDLPIILVTGYSEAVDKERAFRIGIRDFLEKPVKKAELSVRIKEVFQSGANSHS